jgi:branched-chain amino acid transport system ATP-binding protein
MLRVESLNVFIGKAHILKDVSLNVEEGEIVSIVGANGAGKTTLINTISCFMRQKSGSVFFEETCLDRVRYDQVVAMGLVQVPEGRMLFPSLTVQENLEMGAQYKEARVRLDGTFQEVFEIFPVLEKRKSQPAGTLSGGEQQMLAIGRGLMSRPKLLMLDELSLGLAPLVVIQMFEVVREVNRQGMTVLFVEQNVRSALKVSSRAYVLENGMVVREGNSEDLLQDEYTRKAFLGL